MQTEVRAGLQARFVVMGNVFPTDVRLHRRYDLKGSTLGRTSARKAGDPNTVLKVALTHTACTTPKAFSGGKEGPGKGGAGGGGGSLEGH